MGVFFYFLISECWRKRGRVAQEYGHDFAVNGREFKISRKKEEFRDNLYMDVKKVFSYVQNIMLTIRERRPSGTMTGGLQIRESRQKSRKD
jgi:hypothetical protein